MNILSKTFISALSLLLIFSLKIFSQNIEFQSIETTWSNSLNHWQISTSKGTFDLRTTWSDDYYSWTLELPNGDNARIKTVWSNDPSQWKLISDSLTIEISQVWSDDWHKWEIEWEKDPLTSLFSLSVFTNSLGSPQVSTGTL